MAPATAPAHLPTPRMEIVLSAATLSRIWAEQTPAKCYSLATEEYLPVPLLMSDEDAELFFATCENPPAAPAGMVEMMKDVTKWFQA